MSITQIVHSNLQRRPAAEAVCDGDTRIDYRRFADRIAKLAGGLQAQGVGSGQPVAILSLNSHRYLESVFAIAWAAARLNMVNIRWSVEEIAYSLNDCEATALIVDDAFLAMAAPLREKCPSLKTLIYAGDGDCPDGMLRYESLIENSQPVPDAYVADEEMLGIFYTGGTTGKPKGVMLSHRSLMLFTANAGMLMDLEAEWRMLTCAPLFHIAGFGITVSAMLLGCPIVVIPGFDPQAVAKTVRAESIQSLLLVPTMVQMLLDAPGFQASDFASLRTVCYGASPMPMGTLNKLQSSLPEVTLNQGYGMTECGLISIAGAECHDARARDSGRIRSAGRPGLFNQVCILGEDGQPCPPGAVGEICLRGPNVMLGYWNKPDATAQTIVDGWLHTGDGGYMDADGYVFIVDRVKDMIISGGENIYSCEVETVLTQHPAVAQCGVIGIPSDEWGETVHAVIVAAQDADAGSLSVDGLRAFCKQHIAGYKCPRSFEIVDALPISGAGKILKTELRKPYWEGREKQVA
ncbi:MAG: long-chain-fatty-acid--CoA ligase [Panacagrimonas sp.]